MKMPVLSNDCVLTHTRWYMPGLTDSDYLAAYYYLKDAWNAHQEDYSLPSNPRAAALRGRIMAGSLNVTPVPSQRRRSYGSNSP